MDIVDFSKHLTVQDKLQSIFTNYFDKHIAMYYLTSAVPVDVTAEVDKAMIKYVVKPDKVEELGKIVDHINIPVTVYDKTYYPSIKIMDEYLIIELNNEVVG